MVITFLSLLKKSLEYITKNTTDDTSNNINRIADDNDSDDVVDDINDDFRYFVFIANEVSNN